MEFRQSGKKIILLLLLAVALAGMGICIQAHIETSIIQTFKDLDKKDLAVQGSLDSENSENIIRQIYCGRQLPKAMAYFKELKTKGLRLKLNSVEYKKIEVLDHDFNSAVLLVNSKYNGDYVTADSSQESMRKLGIDLLCQVELAKESGDWKISNIVMLQD